ncbi:MAG: hypothetical protein ACR2QK_15250 [Acidimicrobiales bacterium]
MPTTAKIMLALMMMGMMVMGGGVVVNFVDSARFLAVASGLRRMGVARRHRAGPSAR